MHLSRWRNRSAVRAAGTVFLASALLISAPAAADEYDSKYAGHPLRIAAYVLYPIGFAVETLLLKPMHWLVSRQPLQTVFGHED